jgi:YD repeat-containing protein
VLATCFSSGAKEVTWVPEGRTVEYKPDGSVCLSRQTRAGAAGTITTYRDGQGNVVAVTRDLDEYGERVEVDCDGKKTTAELSRRCSIVAHTCTLNGKCAL